MSSEDFTPTACIFLFGLCIKYIFIDLAFNTKSNTKLSLEFFCGGGLEGDSKNVNVKNTEASVVAVGDG